MRRRAHELGGVADRRAALAVAADAALLEDEPAAHQVVGGDRQRVVHQPVAAVHDVEVDRVRPTPGRRTSPSGGVGRVARLEGHVRQRQLRAPSKPGRRVAGCSGDLEDDLLHVELPGVADQPASCPSASARRRSGRRPAGRTGSLKSGMIESGSTKRGSKKCAVCQSSGWNPPSWLRSGPMRAVPKMFGLSSLVAKSPGSEIARIEVEEARRARPAAACSRCGSTGSRWPRRRCRPRSALACQRRPLVGDRRVEEHQVEEGGDERRDREGEQPAEEHQQRRHQHLLARVARPASSGARWYRRDPFRSVSAIGAHLLSTRPDGRPRPAADSRVRCSRAVCGATRARCRRHTVMTMLRAWIEAGGEDHPAGDAAPRCSTGAGSGGRGPRLTPVIQPWPCTKAPADSAMQHDDEARR